MSEQKGPDPALLHSAMALRAERPWLYYRLEHADMKAWLEKVSNERDALKKALRERMEAEHDNATHWPIGSERDGHAGELATCPHPDCTLVR